MGMLDFPAIVVCFCWFCIRHQILHLNARAGAAMSSADSVSSRGWKMIRVRPATHALFTELQERRELARGKGQILMLHHDAVTQDDVLLYLLAHESGTQERRKRSRQLRRASGSSLPGGIESGATPYTSHLSDLGVVAHESYDTISAGEEGIYSSEARK